MAMLSTNAAKVITLLARPDHTLQRREGYKYYVVDADCFMIHRAHNQTVKSLEKKGYIEATKTDKRETPLVYEITEDGKNLAEFMEG